MNTWLLFVQSLAFLLLLDLLAFAPWFKVFFGSGKIALGWALSLIGLVWGGALGRLWGTVFLYAVFRHFYIQRRWSNVRRGGGAPGFMSHWTMLYLLALQLAAFLDGSGRLAHQVHWVMKVDFATIMVCAGSYKALVGFLKGDGMECGRVNPLWGYQWRLFKEGNPRSSFVTINNWLASLVEIVAGLMMYVSGTLQQLGAVAISLSFVYVALFIRLGRLAWLMALLPLIYAPSLIDGLLLSVPYHLQLPEPVLQGLMVGCQVFVASLAVVKFTQYYNLFANRQLVEPLQTAITTYANFVPIIIWRVFTPDVINFFLRIYECRKEGEVPILDEDTFSLSNWRDFWAKWRFWHVTESIALVSVFTTLKYFPSRPELFQAKLLDYARSLAPTLGRPLRRLRFEYVSIVKGTHRFEFRTVGNFFVDLENGSVERQDVEPGFDYSAPAQFSPVRESAAPGSYLPAR